MESALLMVWRGRGVQIVRITKIYLQNPLFHDPLLQLGYRLPDVCNDV